MQRKPQGWMADKLKENDKGNKWRRKQVNGRYENKRTWKNRNGWKTEKVGSKQESTEVDGR